MRTVHLTAVLLLSGCLLVSSLARSQCIDYGEYPHWVRSFVANASCTALSGSAAVVPDGAGLYFINVNPMNPGGPEILSRLELGGAGWGMTLAAASGLVYAGQSRGFCQGGAVQVIDASDPRNPVLLGSVDTPGDVGPLAGSGKYCYVGESCILDGLQVIDTSNPDQPSIVGTLGMPGGVEGVAVSGGYAFLTVCDQVHYPYPSYFDVVDISDPRNPFLVSQIASPGGAGPIAIAGHYAYIAGLEIVDIADPAHPAIVANITAPFGSKYISGGRLFDAVSRQIQIFDLTDPVAPTLLGSISTPAFGCTVVVLGSNICLAADDFYVYGLGNSSSPPVIGTLGASGQARDVAVFGDHAYVADSGAGLLVADVSQPADPQIVGTVALPSPATCVRVIPPLAYVVMERGLAVVDVSDSGHPRLLGSVATTYGLGALAVDGGHAYVTGGDGTSGYLFIFDVSNPTAPQIVGTLNTSGLASGVGVSGDYAYVGVRTPSWPYVYNLRVVRVSDPAHPQIVTSLEGAYGFALAVSGHLVFLYSAALTVVDITNPIDPWIVGTVDGPMGPGAYAGICVDGNLVYTSNDRNCDVVDVSHPEAPWIIGSADGGGAGLAVSGSYLYAACYGVGIHELRIMPAQCNPSSGIDERTGPLATTPDAFPNPTEGAVTLRCTTAGPGWTRASIHDVGGRVVRELQGWFPAAGTHLLTWDGRGRDGREVAAGVYLARLSTTTGTRTARVAILR